MKQSPSANAMHEAVATYIEQIAVPAYNASAVVASRGRGHSDDKRGAWSLVRGALAVCIALAAIVVLAPAVVAQVERVMQAFTFVNGRTVQLPTRGTSLSQLRGDMPFAVVVPAGISPALQENIEEVGAGSSSAHAIFLYSRNEGPPVLTIIENSARESAPSANFGMTYSTTGHAPVLPPVPPRLAPGSGVAISRTNDRFFSVRVASTSWITHGTRITLISMPGAFTRAEIDEILKAMR